MTSMLLILLHGALMAGVILRVLLRRPARGVALAWLMLAMALPYLGAILYFLIGEQRIPKRRVERLEKMRSDFRRLAAPHVERHRVPDDAVQSHDSRALQRAGLSFFGVPPIAGNSLALSSDTLEMLPRIAADIDAAQRSVLMEFYIWSEGGLTAGVRDALIRAAGRGVECLVLIDAMGAGNWWRSNDPDTLRAAGVKLRQALPVGLLYGLAARTDLRLHRKIVVIDGAVAWTGSMNMVDPRYFKQDAGVGEWVDAMARIEGPVAGLLAAVMMGDWIAELGDDLDQVVQDTRLTVADPQGDVPVQVLASGPGESGEGLLQVMLALINAADREVIITTPYFVPEDQLVTALRGAAARGVKVVIVLPKRIDSIMVRYASRSFFDEILEMGGEIREFRNGLLHTKSIVIDGAVAMFGTANFDMRSLWLNYEVSLLVYGGSFIAELRQLQSAYIEASDKVSLVPWPERPLLERLRESALRLLSPLL
jgi:cardiolipin synthase